MTFSPVPFDGASVALAAGAVVGLELDELEFEFPPHAARADDITSNVESPTKLRFILFISLPPLLYYYFGFL
ncbi:hypothetical protein D3C76_1476180 [compost metagenome]